MKRATDYFPRPGHSLSKEIFFHDHEGESDEDVHEIVFALRQRESSNITASHYEKSQRLGFNLTGHGPPPVTEIFDNFSPKLKRAIVESDRAFVNPADSIDLDIEAEVDESDSLKTAIFESKGRTFTRRFAFEKEGSDADESSDAETVNLEDRVRSLRRARRLNLGADPFGTSIGIEVTEKVLEEKRQYPNFIDHKVNLGVLSFGKILRPSAEEDYVTRWKWECSKKIKPLWKIPATGSKGFVSTHNLLKQKYKEKSLALKDDEDYRLDEVYLIFAIDGEMIKMDARSNFEGFRNKFGDRKPQRIGQHGHKNEPKFRYVFDLAGYHEREIIMKLYPGNRLFVKGIKSYDPLTVLPEMSHVEGIPIPEPWKIEGLYAWRTELGLLVIEDADNIHKIEPKIPPLNLDLDYLKSQSRGFKPVSAAEWGRIKKL